jgi:hypothetical protein
MNIPTLAAGRARRQPRPNVMRATPFATTAVTHATSQTVTGCETVTRDTRG